MKLFGRGLVVVMVMAAILPLFAVNTGHAQEDSGADDNLADGLYVELNAGLIEEGTLPLGRSEALDSVAQVIADELGETGSYSSVTTVLADEFDYPRWDDNSQRVISEPYQLIGNQNPFEAATFLKSDVAALVDQGFYREVGIATSTRVAVAGGTEQNVYVIVLGAQPNVFPLIINDGADTVYEADVELYVHNELSLAYETTEDTVQQIQQIRYASTEAGLEDASWLTYEENAFGFAWTLDSELGEQTVFVEVEDAKGARTISEATVTLDDPANAPTPTPSAAEVPITLVMTYGGDTFTMQIETERTDVRLQEVFFTWLDDLRAYELENADNLSDVDLEDFSPDACIQVRVRATQEGATEEAIVDVEGCSVIYLEANEFTELDQVFWNPDFGEFTVYDGPRELGVCDTQSSSSCEIELR